MKRNDKPDREECVRLLKSKAEETGRMPKKSDFDPYETMMIKSYFGPWPRALEAAGLKTPPETDRLTQNRIKRAAHAAERKGDKNNE